MYGRRHGGRRPFGLLDPEQPFGGFPFEGRGARRGGPSGRGRRNGRGAVRAAILLLLGEEPRNGHQIIQEAERRSGGLWSPRPGAVYPTLQQLADEGLVRGEEIDGRRVFTLTDEGREHVAAAPPAEPWAEPFPGAGELAAAFRDAARLQAALVQVVRDGSPELVAEARRLVDEARRALHGLLAGGRTADAPEAK
ncbi:PadR family transcriptional regulator [Actinocorallia populi]|uniref:PadR family transcriptional regulator n=1 Tax=Actinocorallia populi TaxID=2079200 RepID=UPI000D095BBC|nr:PadR family transcriptional regulator [Actinocorallia populi]